MIIETVSEAVPKVRQMAAVTLCGEGLDSQTFGPVTCRKREGHKGLHKWWNHAGRSTIWSAQTTDAA